MRILITGGGTGIGFAIARAFTEDGASVVIAGRRSEILRKAADKIGGNISWIAEDVASVDGSRRLVEKAVSRLSGVDVLVNSAGTIRRNIRLHEYTDDVWASIIDTNLSGAANVTRFALPSLLQGKGNRSVINISSTLATRGARGVSAYAAAKSALIGLTRACALDYGSEGIRFNCIVLGAVETDMAYVDRDFEAIRKDFIAAYPLKRLGQPEEVAAAAIFLAKASWITGACLTLDGGLSVS